MATFGSLAGRIDPSRDYLAEALSQAGQNLGQGISQAGQGIAAGMVRKQEMDAAKEQKKVAQFQADSDQLQRRIDSARGLQGNQTPEMQERINQLEQQEYARLKQDYFGGDNVARVLNDPPKQQAPVQAQPQQSKQPQAIQAAPPLGAQSPVSFSSVYAGAGENQRKQEADKNERESIEAYRSQSRKLGVTDKMIDTDPELSQFKGRTLTDWENIQAIGQQRDTARRERAAAIVASIKVSGDRQKMASELRGDHEQQVKPFQNVIDQATKARGLIETNNPQSGVLAIAAVRRMVDDSQVTGAEYEQLAGAGGILAQLEAEIKQTRDGRLTPAAARNLRDVVESLENDAASKRDAVNLDYEYAANAAGVNPGIVVGGRFRSAKPRQTGGKVESAPPGIK
jgi:hypothetical protein